MKRAQLCVYQTIKYLYSNLTAHDNLCWITLTIYKYHYWKYRYSAKKYTW